MQKKKLVPDALRKHKLHVLAQDLYTDYPRLGDITESLAEFVTAHFPGKEYPLFEECIIAAFSNMQAAEKNNKDVYVGYLIGLVSLAWHLMDKRIAVHHDGVCTAWVPMRESVAEFVDRFPNGTVEIFDEPAPGNVSHHHAAIMLAARIMPASDANMVVSSIGHPDEVAA